MSTEVTIRDMELLWRTAGHVAKSNFAPKDMRNNQEEVYAALLTGMELGLGPMASLRHISVIDGKPSLSAAMQLALLRRAGHRIEVVESSATRCQIVGRGPDGTSLDVEYTIEEAKAAGLINDRKPNWIKYPKDMLWARCVSRYARRADTGATLGLYSPADWDTRDTVTLEPEEYARVVTEPSQEPEVDEVGTPDMFQPAESAAEPMEKGELPLKPADLVPPVEPVPPEDHRIIVSCPACGDKVGTQELEDHMINQHALKQDQA